MIKYPVEARAPNGQLWWELLTWPDSKQRFGVETKLAAWLTFNTQLGDVITIRQLRDAITGPNGVANTDEHFNRRLRRLRDFDWVIPSHREDSSLAGDEYRLEKFGYPIWLGKKQFSVPGPSAKVRREVLDRDGNRCRICGVGAGEEYPDQPGKRARMTIGHFRAGSLKGPAILDNLRAECSLCNEPLRDELSSGETAK